MAHLLGVSAAPRVSCNQSLSRWSTRGASSVPGPESGSTQTKCNKDGNESWTTSSGLEFAQSSRHPKPNSVVSSWCAKWHADAKQVDGYFTAVRSGLMATEINSHASEGVSQFTLQIECSTLMLSLASSRTRQVSTT